MTKSVSDSLTLDRLADASHRLAQRLATDEHDWMSLANADSARALCDLATEAALARTQNGSPPVDDLKAPLLAAVGAADLALATVNEILASLRERAEDARTEATTRVEERRAQVTKLQDELPSQVAALRDKLSADELRKAAEGYAEAATATYNKLVERGEEALTRLRSQPALEDAAISVESVTDEAVELTQDALGTVATQTRAARERAAKLVGVELPSRAAQAVTPVQRSAAKAPVRKVAAKTAAARKGSAKRSVRS